MDMDGKYRLRDNETAGQPLRLWEIHWVNFGWGTEVDPTSEESRMVHHPNQVWFRKNV